MKLLSTVSLYTLLLGSALTALGAEEPFAPSAEELTARAEKMHNVLLETEKWLPEAPLEELAEVKKSLTTDMIPSIEESLVIARSHGTTEKILALLEKSLPLAQKILAEMDKKLAGSEALVEAPLPTEAKPTPTPAEQPLKEKLLDIEKKVSKATPTELAEIKQFIEETIQNRTKLFNEVLAISFVEPAADPEAKKIAAEVEIAEKILKAIKALQAPLAVPEAPKPALSPVGPPIIPITESSATTPEKTSSTEKSVEMTKDPNAALIKKLRDKLREIIDKLGNIETKVANKSSTVKDRDELLALQAVMNNEVLPTAKKIFNSSGIFLGPAHNLHIDANHVSLLITLLLKKIEEQEAPLSAGRKALNWLASTSDATLRIILSKLPSGIRASLEDKLGVVYDNEGLEKDRQDLINILVQDQLNNPKNQNYIPPKEAINTFLQKVDDYEATQKGPLTTPQGALTPEGHIKRIKQRIGRMMGW